MMKFKKLRLAVLFIATIAVVSCFAIGCTDKTKKGVSTKDYYGTYSSVFVDSQNKAGDLNFSLEINDDKTFKLTKAATVTTFNIFRGTWKSFTDSGNTQLICIVESGYKWNDNYPNAWSPYFTLCLLDDGTLMATPGSTSSSTSVVTAFGSGSITAITLVLFEKN